MKKNFRIELSFKTIEQLKKKIEFCTFNNIYNFNIPCKGQIKKEFLSEVVEYIGKNYADINVIYHYSLFHQFERNRFQSYKKFLNFVYKSQDYKNKEILLVSGSNKKKDFDVIDLLSDLKDELNLDTNFGIAYNPYLKGEENIIERNRLIKKLNSGLIKSIWLQFGSNVNDLIKETKFLKENFYKENSLNMYGSIFIPSKQSLSRFKFRPWKGVYLSSEYLNSLEVATEVTKYIFNIYSENNILPLIETDCSNIRQLKELKELIT